MAGNLTFIRTAVRLSVMDRLRVLWHGRVEVSYTADDSLINAVGERAEWLGRLLGHLRASAYVAKVLPRLKRSPPLCSIDKEPPHARP